MEISVLDMRIPSVKLLVLLRLLHLSDKILVYHHVLTMVSGLGATSTSGLLGEVGRLVGYRRVPERAVPLLLVSSLRQVGVASFGAEVIFLALGESWLQIIGCGRY